jgi:hypothetical protein
MASITREEALATLDDGQARVDALIAQLSERGKGESVEQARERCRRAHEALAGTIRDMDNAEWHMPAPYPTPRRAWLGMIMGSITGAPKRAYGHSFAHLPDLEAYVAELRK